MKGKEKSTEVDQEKQLKTGERVNSNKKEPSRKEKKKQREWAKLKAFEILQNKIFRPADLEPKFNYIQDKEDLTVKDSDFKMIQSVVNLSKHNNNIEFRPYLHVECKILPFFQERLKEYDLFLKENPIHPTLPITPRCKKLNLIDEKFIKQILRNNF